MFIVIDDIFWKEINMANITRYRPFEDFGSIFDDLSKGFFLRPIRFKGELGTDIKMDVSEDDKAYKVRAEIPGVKKEDIKVSIDGNQVSISAEVKQEKEKKEGEKVISSERYYGQVYRSFSLDNDVDEAKAEAKYTDGILNLTLPKKAGVAAKQLSVS
jgi:HSP20 family protein